MALWLMVLVNKTDNLSFIPGSHKMETTESRMLPSDIYTLDTVYTLYIHT